MKIKYFALFLILNPVAWGLSDQAYRKFQRLYVWKVSQALNLGLEKENKLGQILEKCHKDKHKYHDQKKKALSCMARSPKNEACLEKYKKAEEAVALLPFNELRDLEALLSKKGLVHYLIKKDETIKELELVLKQKAH